MWHTHASPIVDIVQVCRASNAGGKGCFDTGVPLNEAAHIVAEFAIPFPPDVPVGEAAHLVEAPTVPGLCNQLDLKGQR